MFICRYYDLLMSRPVFPAALVLVWAVLLFSATSAARAQLAWKQGFSTRNSGLNRPLLSRIATDPYLGDTLPPRHSWQIAPYLMIQSWGIYSHHTGQYDTSSTSYRTLPPTWSFLLRRGRIGLKAQSGERLSSNVSLAFDQIGHGASLAPKGPAAPATPEIVLWDAQFQYQLFSRQEWAFVTTGFFRPQMGRENITSGFLVPSFEKALSQLYLRRHLTNTNHGRAPGLNVGGLFSPKSGWMVGYQVGAFSPAKYGGFSSHSDPSSPLLLGRVVLNLGDPEQENYRLNYQVQYFGRRQGISLAIAGATQGKTAAFSQAQTLGVDMLANYGRFSLDGEWNWMWKQSDVFSPSAPLLNETGYLRLAMVFPVQQSWLEASVMYSVFRGPASETLAREVAAFAGEESAIDLGLNWYLMDRKIKWGLHYTWQSGVPGDTGLGSTANDFFYQPELGAIHRGDYLGLGLIVLMGT